MTGTDEYICPEMVHIQGITNFNDCAKECLLAQGGPNLACSYMNFDHSGLCWLSSVCTGHHRPTEKMTHNPAPAEGLNPDATFGVMQGALCGDGA